MLPDIKISLPILVVLWCVAGYWAMGGPVLLLYPAMWGVVTLLFVAGCKLLGSAPDAEAASDAGSAA